GVAGLRGSEVLRQSGCLRPGAGAGVDGVEERGEFLHRSEVKGNATADERRGTPIRQKQCLAFVPAVRAARTPAVALSACIGVPRRFQGGSPGLAAANSAPASPSNSVFMGCASSP